MAVPPVGGGIPPGAPQREQEARARQSEAAPAPIPKAEHLAAAAAHAVPAREAAARLAPDGTWAQGVDPASVPQDAPRVLAAVLVSYESDPLGTVWNLYQGGNVVGRMGAGAHLDIEIAHPTTSSRHALLRASARPGRVTIEDLGSTNGTRVNDQRLVPGHPVEAHDGDRIYFGLFSSVLKVV